MLVIEMSDVLGKLRVERKPSSLMFRLFPKSAKIARDSFELQWCPLNFLHAIYAVLAAYGGKVTSAEFEERRFRGEVFLKPAEGYGVLITNSEGDVTVKIRTDREDLRNLAGLLEPLPWSSP